MEVIFFLLKLISLHSSNSYARFQPGEMTLCADEKMNNPLSREVQVYINTIILCLPRKSPVIIQSIASHSK